MVKVRNHGRTAATNSKRIPMDRIRITDTSSSHRATGKDGTTTSTNSHSRTMDSRAGTATTTTTNSRSRTMDKAGRPAISSSNRNSRRMASSRTIGTSKATTNSSNSLHTTIGTKAIASSSTSRRSRMICLTLATSVRWTSRRSMILPGAKARPGLQKMTQTAGTMSARSTKSTSLTILGASKAIATISLRQIPGARAGTAMIR